MSSAAVMTVYATGYLRTQSAAAKLDAAERNRIVIPVEAPDTHGKAAPDAQPLRPSPVSTTRIEAPADAERTSARRRTRAESETQTVAAKPIGAPSSSAPASPQPALTPTEPANTSPIPTPPAAPLSGETAKWKDGTYTGWGTSRHGDIEATVVIESGRIASAVISQCLTRYACTWVEHLQGQVVTRQSPEVDYVSGATQSTNAFYYAVVQALSKAK